MRREGSYPDLAMSGANPEFELPNLTDARRLKKCRDIAIVCLIYSAVLMVFYGVVGIRREQWQLFALAGGELLALVSFLMCLSLIRRKQLIPAMWWLVGAGEFSLVFRGLFIQGIGPFLGLCAILLVIIEISAVLESVQTNRFAIFGIFSGFLAVFLNAINPTNLDNFRLDMPLIFVSSGVFLAILVAIYLILILRRYISLSIQTKLLTAFLVATLIPLSIIAVLNNTLTRQALISEASKALAVAANQTANLVETSIKDNINVIQEEARIPSLVTYLTLAPNRRSGGPEEVNARLTLRTLLTKDAPNLTSYAILDTRGKNILDTDPKSLGRDESDYPYFKMAMNNEFSQYNPVFFDPYTGLSQIIFVSPITDNRGNIGGVLRARYKGDFFLKKMMGYMDIVQKGSYPILFDENQVRLADPVDTSSQYKTLIPLPPQTFQALQEAQRLPRLKPAELTTNLPAFSTRLDKSGVEPFFLADVQGTNTIQAGAIARLKLSTLASRLHPITGCSPFTGHSTNPFIDHDHRSAGPSGRPASHHPGRIPIPSHRLPYPCCPTDLFR